MARAVTRAASRQELLLLEEPAEICGGTGGMFSGRVDFALLLDFEGSGMGGGAM
jgi:hypothetical protein